MGKKETALKNLEKAHKTGATRKGVKNKFTTLKQAFLDAFEEIGGEEALAKWAKGPLNRKDFYGMITKLLPKEVEGTLELKNPPPITVIFTDKKE